MKRSQQSDTDSDNESSLNDANRYPADQNEKGSKQSYLLKILEENRVTRSQIRDYITVLCQRIQRFEKKLKELKGLSTPADQSSEGIYESVQEEEPSAENLIKLGKTKNK